MGRAHPNMSHVIYSVFSGKLRRFLRAVGTTLLVFLMQEGRDYWLYTRKLEV